MKKLVYRLEECALRVVFAGLRCVPIRAASAIGGRLGEWIGPFFSAHHTALDNLSHVFPEMDDAQRRTIRRRMWNHLGRVAAEYPFLRSHSLTERIQITGIEYLPPPGTPVLFFSGHFGNWELLCPVAYLNGTKDLCAIYRHINNPYVDRIIGDLRLLHASELIAKGMRGGIRILTALKRGASVAMLVDQKTNNGIPVPFFGRNAMTSPAIAEIALKYDIPIVPARVVRLPGARFEGTLYAPIPLPRTGDHKQDVQILMQSIHSVLEGWIREYPEQWFWVHRRWPKESLAHPKTEPLPDAAP